MCMRGPLPKSTPHPLLSPETADDAYKIQKLRCGVKSRVATEQPACRWLLTESVIYTQHITRITRKVRPRMINTSWRIVLNQEPQVPGLSQLRSKNEYRADCDIQLITILPEYDFLQLSLTSELLIYI